MPMVRPAGPPEPRSHARVARTESLKSERSDKRVSFNKDVGVKHIPRGQKNQQLPPKNNIIRVTPSDEWARCSEVYREPVALSSQELEKQAEEIVKLLDNINCDSAPNSLAVNTRSLDRPKNKNNKNAAHQNYNNVVINNVRNNSSNLTNNKNINVLNGEPRGRPRTLPTSRTANPINRRVKGDVNRVIHSSPSPIPNGGPLAHHRHRSADHLPDTDLDSPPLARRAHHLAGHKSVPDLNTVYYDNKEANNYKYKHLIGREQEPGVGFKSVDNLYDADEPNPSINFVNNKAGYKSVDNLTEANQLSSGRLQGFKSVGHLPSVVHSDSDVDEMSRREPYKPKVGNIIKKFNADAEEVRRGGTAVMMDMATEMDTGPRGTLEPDRYNNHNNNQPFSYTGSSPLASVRAVRRLSPPPRDLPRPSPPRESPPREPPVYAQVSKRDGRSQSNGRRESDRNYINSRQEREYSAKIIITDNDHRPPYQDFDDHSPYRDTPPKNHYQDEDDDDAYESYQVPEDNLRRLLHEDLMPQHMLSSEDLLEEYKEHSNNNINMSSVGVQTDALPKAPSRSRKTSKSPAPSPPRQLPPQVQKQHSQRQQQSHHTAKKQEFSHQQNLRQQKKQDYSVNHRSGNSTIHNNLTSASLVRQVNHGFGRTDRSPSPPPRVSASRQPRRNVVPLLSDTSDSEAEHRRQPFDPLARIRDQVMQREKLQEEEEEEEESRHGRLIKDSSVMPYKTEDMTPLTIDEVDALSLIMEDTGRKTLVVSNQAKSNTVTRVSNHRSRRSETITEHNPSHNSKDSLSRPQKPPREKNHVPREPTPTRKEPSTLEKNKKNNLEKERANKAAKQKEEKKEKKKKRIKIKFFYDPRPQDDPNIDPLARFTEFRGSSSEERASPRDERREDRRDRKEEHKEDYHNERMTSHREEHHSDRRGERDDYRHRRGLPDVLEDTTDTLKERRSSSRERLDSTPRPNKHGSREIREIKSNREQSHESLNSYNNKRRDSKDSRDSRDNRSRETRSRSRDDRVSYNESADERRNYERNERSVDRDYSDNDERGSPDGRPGRSLSDKYKSGPLYDPPEEENSPPPEIRVHPPAEEAEKQQKTMRQRKKFFSVLRSDGRSSSPSKSTPPKSKTNQLSPIRSNKKGPAPTHPPPSSQNPGSTEKAKEKTPAKKKPTKKKRAWPWALLGLRGGGRGQSHGSQSGGPTSGKVGSSRVSSRASSRASSRSSHRPRRPSVRASKIHREGQPAWLNRDRDEVDEGSPPPAQQWESATLSRAELKARKDARQGDSRGYSTTQRTTARKHSAESSASSSAPPPPRVARTTSFKHRYFGDTDVESNRGGVNAVPDYRSLPNRASRSAHKNVGKGRRTATGPRGMSPPVVGSAGSSLQSSESEVDSHGGSHASRASKASHVSTGSNRSVYLHATAVADIPVRRGQEETPSERTLSRQQKKVSRSFSMLAPWKPRHYREKYEVDYENHEAHDGKGEANANNSKDALPPRPPRRPVNDSNDKKVNRSQSMYKDSRLAGWLRRRRNKEAKGI